MVWNIWITFPILGIIWSQLTKSIIFPRVGTPPSSVSWHRFHQGFGLYVQNQKATCFLNAGPGWPNSSHGNTIFSRYEEKKPSSKLTVCYLKPLLIGESSISMGHGFHSKHVSWPEGNTWRCSMAIHCPVRLLGWHILWAPQRRVRRVEGEGPETLRSQCGVESQRRCVVGVSCSCVPVVGFGSIRGPPIGWFDCGFMVSQCEKMTSPFADSSCWKIT